MKIIKSTNGFQESLNIDGVSIDEIDHINVSKYLIEKLSEELNRGEISISDIIHLFQYDSIETMESIENDDITTPDSISKITWEI